jgi:hypothetical protein
MKHGLMGIGMVLIAIGLLGMVVVHEYAISEYVALIGIILFGIAWVTIPDREKPVINTDRVNENIQNFNDILWGKEKKPPKEPEPPIQIIIVNKK